MVIIWCLIVGVYNWEVVVIIPFRFRFTLRIEACYLQPTVICSEPITGIINVIPNTCPTYVGDTEITISPTLGTNARAFTLQTRDLDSEHFGQLRYQLIGDTQSIRDFTITSTGEVRTTSSFRANNVAVYNMQIILSDEAGLSSCFVPINIRVVVNRNVFGPEFSSTSTTVTVLEIHSVLDSITTLSVRMKS